MSHRITTWRPSFPVRLGGVPRIPHAGLLLLPEPVGKTFGGVDIANGDEELAPLVALRRHAAG